MIHANFDSEINVRDQIIFIFSRIHLIWLSQKLQVVHIAPNRKVKEQGLFEKLNSELHHLICTLDLAFTF